MTMRLEFAVGMGYAEYVPVQTGAGICNPSQSAQALTRSVFFVPPVYGGCRGGSSERRSSDRYCKPCGTRPPSSICNERWWFSNEVRGYRHDC